MAGWIKIDRKIQEHWIWKDPVKLKWWLDILMTVNYEDNKVAIGYKIFDCKRGESLMSLKSWADRWGVSKSVVNNFFNMLKCDNMVVLKSETVTIRITVCNYDSYQQVENASETQEKRKRNARETHRERDTYTIKEREEIKEGKEEYIAEKFNFLKSLISLGIEEAVAKDWINVRKAKRAANTETAFKAIEKEIKLSNIPATDCIRIAVERSWQGFKAEWINKNTQNGNKQQQTGFSRKDYDPNNGIGTGERLSSTKRSVIFSSKGL